MCCSIYSKNCHIQVFSVLQVVIDGDKAVEVRRAAVLVVTLILQGLGRDAFSVCI